MNLAERLEAARAEVAHLERLAATATCRELGCDMKHVGGANCGCMFADDEGNELPGCCSIPVLKCTRCGDCDYGQNPEAAEVKERCADGFPNG
jgi:hypothetical protein